MTKKTQPEKINVLACGGTKNLTFSIAVHRADGSGVTFTLSPAGAVSLAEQLSSLVKQEGL